MEQVIYRRFKEIKILLDKGANPNLTTETGFSALFYAGMQSQSEPDLSYDICEILLKKGANPNLVPPPVGHTILQEMKQMNPQSRIIQLLLDHGGI